MQNTSFKPLQSEVKNEPAIQDDSDRLENQEVLYQGDMYVAHEQVIEMPENTEAPFYVPDFIAQINMSAINRDHTTCQLCGEDLTNRRFYNHLFDHHGFTKQQCEALKQQKRLENFNNRPSRGRKATKTHECGVCGLEFVTKSGLTSHLSKALTCSMQEEQVNGKTSVHNIVCPSFACNKNVATYLDLAIHVDTEHRELSTQTDSFRIRRVTFPDKSSFMRWKKNMEAESCSEFFLRTSQKVSFAVRTYLYKCVYSNSRGQSNGRRCEQCPAFIKACERNHGQFEVVACFGHLGHEHYTETEAARRLREEKYKVIDQLQERQLMAQRVNQREGPVLVEAYGQQGTSNDMMILIPAEGEEEDEYSQEIVDDADDEILGERGQETVQTVPVTQVYVPSHSHHPGPSVRHYQ